LFAWWGRMDGNQRRSTAFRRAGLRWPSSRFRKKNQKKHIRPPSPTVDRAEGHLPATPQHGKKRKLTIPKVATRRMDSSQRANSRGRPFPKEGHSDVSQVPPPPPRGPGQWSCCWRARDPQGSKRTPKTRTLIARFDSFGRRVGSTQSTRRGAPAPWRRTPFHCTRQLFWSGPGRLVPRMRITEGIPVPSEGAPPAAHRRRSHAEISRTPKAASPPRGGGESKTIAWRWIQWLWDPKATWAAPRPHEAVRQPGTRPPSSAPRRPGTDPPPTVFSLLYGGGLGPDWMF